MNAIQLGYHAGIIDGEGTISIGKTKDKIYNRYGYNVHISVENTNIVMLEHLKFTSGLGNIWPRKESRENKKPSWVWYIGNNYITEYLLLIKDHLIIKKEQAVLMLEFMERCTGAYGLHNRVPEKVKLLREVIYQEMKELNKQGV